MQDLITPPLPIEITGGTIQYTTAFWITGVVIILLLVGWLLGRNLKKYPGRRQVAAELLVGWMDRLCKDILGENRGRKYLFLFGSLFLFVLACNLAAVLPIYAMPGFPRLGLEIGGQPYRDFNDNGQWDADEPAVDGFGRTVWDIRREPGFVIPTPEEPTRNINVPIGLSLFLAIAMYTVALFVRGLKSSFKQLFEPMWFMFPLNLIGQVAQVLSVSFRLFGNIFGSAVIVIVVSGLLYDIVLPIGVNAFMGLFVGIIQAFVFTMLWITYHADWVAETESQA